ncbi:Saccharopine dehydrogenase [NAD(+), L-lysine-forming] [Mycena indigotica]|uniref:Saccharopine dehydrogenase [NAD(+), L-lysine-forming] n=1 Tax=Mycena indigotica TaxID=2126181 RepID=A0A8H6SWE8_9AGAR|nr:Saccharopine dehydrogenase [NAD(+), L-lysine-forming] [Mycena indigotica]KAF7306681.1 Saccharopine dehydrogenase [NAD(+), L-lysine-forming] [Mycena indigotica]
MRWSRTESESFFSSSTTMTSLWLRCEKKPFERRAALTPTTAKTLLDAGFAVTVERDEQRIFADSEYEASLIATKIRLAGLKCWRDSIAGGGTLYDLEFLTDPSGRRVAAFGFHAGFAGAAAGALAIASQKKGETLGALEPYENEAAMVAGVKAALGGSGNGIKALVIGALGRCGRGAVDLFRKIGVAEDDILKWDLDETAKGGPFDEILGVDVFVNCIYLNTSIPPFITRERIAAAGQGRRLSVVVDVSCDTTNPFNPIPIYNINTTFPEPTVPVVLGADCPQLSVISIDHLPTLLPREASEQFSRDLLPSLLEYPQGRVWSDAERLFKTKVAEAASVEGL